MGGLLTDLGFGGAGDGGNGSVIFSPSMPDGGLAAKAWRSGSLGIVAVRAGSFAGASAATTSLSPLASRFGMELSTMTEAATSAGPAAGTPSRPKMPATAAPTTSKPVNAMMVAALLKPFSVSPGGPPSLSRQLGKKYGLTVPPRWRLHPATKHAGLMTLRPRR